MSYTVAPSPYTQADWDAALPDDRAHEPRLRSSWLGGTPRCTRLVIAPKTSLYGIRPCQGIASMHTVRSGGVDSHEMMVTDTDPTGTADYNTLIMKGLED